MRLSREKINKLSHLVTEELVRLDNLEFIEDRNTIRLEIVKILNEELKKEEALDHLEKIFGKGWGKKDWIENDKDYDCVRDHPRFIAMMAKLK